MVYLIFEEDTVGVWMEWILPCVFCVCHNAVAACMICFPVCGDCFGGPC